MLLALLLLWVKTKHIESKYVSIAYNLVFLIKS